MAGRDVVNDGPEVLDALCIVLRRHGVTLYERTSDGTLRLELAASGGAPTSTSISADLELERRLVAHEDNERTRQGLPPKEKPPLGLSTIPRTDPLFDGVEDVS